MASCLQFLNKRLKIQLFLVFSALALGFMYFQNTGLMHSYHLMQSFLDGQNYSITADKWIIIDIADTSRDMIRVDIPGWRLLVLGYSGRNSIRCSNCIYFNTHSVTKVRGLSLTNSNTTHVKAQAVLYVISSGAMWILWSVSVNDLQEEIIQLKLKPGQTGLIYKGAGVMDPSSHFTSRENGNKEQVNLYELYSWSLPAIQKIWRPMIYVNISENDIDYHAPPVLVPMFKFHEDCLEGSLFHRSAFWSLVPLMTVNPVRAYILSFWVQRLIWEFRGSFVFLPPVKKTTYTQTAETKNSEKKLRVLNDLLIKLSNWKCSVKRSFYVCVKELAEMMGQWGNFTQGEISTIKDSLLLLRNVQPQRTAADGKPINNVKKTNNDSILSVFSAKGSDVTCKSRVIFNARSRMFVKTLRNVTNVELSPVENPFGSVCRPGLPKLMDVSQTITTSRPLDDILLIIIFNKPGFLANIKYLFYMYSRYFTHILICGDSLDEFVKQPLIKYKVSFIEINVQPGFYGYQCMMEAMQIGYGVKGYLQISDDVLLNVWNIVDLPQHRVWFQSSMRSGNLSSDLVPDIDRSIYWWGWKPGRLTLIQVWKEFSLLLKDQKVSAKIQTFFDTLEINAGHKNSAFYEASDIYYIPSRLKDLYVFYSSWFLKHKVFLEIAIPTVINSLVPQKDVVRLSGSYLWNNRNQYRKKYNPRHVFLHPYKLHVHLSNKRGRTFICERYLSEINTHLKKLSLKNV